MKKNFISFIHQPKKVAAVSLVIAIIIGIFGYSTIHRVPANKFTQNISAEKNIILSFAASGKVKTISVKTGDRAKKGQVLATIDADNEDGSLIQAEALYETAKANYEKVINGATGTAVDFAKSVVNTAQVNLNEITKQQETLVNNAYRTLLNSSLQAESINSNEAHDSPIVSGTYECKKEGAYNLKTYSSSGGISVIYSGIEEGILLLTDVPRPLGNCGLFLSFDKTKELLSDVEYKIEIPNKNAANYNLNNNAYQLALRNEEQAVAGARATLDQAQASLNLVATNARPEDVLAAKAQVESAYGALISNAGYNNTVISAPSDGIINTVYITEGQIVGSAVSAIEFLGL